MADAGNGITAPFFSYEDLRQKADEFLARHHPDGTIPVPIEEIVEFQFDINGGVAPIACLSVCRQAQEGVGRASVPPAALPP